MKLLFDENISYRIVKLIASVFQDCLHTSRTGLSSPIADRGIWEYAKKK